MNIPGFTAEASLFKVSEYYHKIGTDIPGDGTIQPAFWRGGCIKFCADQCHNWDCMRSCICRCSGGRHCPPPS
jgi:hypothetical protein